MTTTGAATMRVVEASSPGGPEGLAIAQRAVPIPGPGHVLVKVAYAGVNGPDIMQRKGLYPPPEGASDLLGLEVAGEVVATGAVVRRWQVGDRLCGLTNGGGYAEYCTVLEEHCLPIPKGVSLAEAASLPEAYFTVWSNIFMGVGLKSGETFLVHGGTSGIGTTAIQLAKAFGAKVIATAGTAEKCDACLRLGADVAINYRSQDFVSAVKEATGGRGVDLILDMVGGEYIPRNYDAAAQDGRIVQIAFLQGPKVEVDFRRLMVKRLTHTGSTLRPRSPAEKAVIARALEDKVWPLLAQGRCRPVMDSTFAFEDVAKAHARMDGGEHIGKIVLTL